MSSEGFLSTLSSPNSRHSHRVKHDGALRMTEVIGSLVHLPANTKVCESKTAGDHKRKKGDLYN